METQHTRSDYGLERVPGKDIQSRITALQESLVAESLDGAFLLQNVDVYYFSGTLQRAILFVPASGEPALMVIKSFQRARNESPLEGVYPLSGREAILPLLADLGHGAFKRVGLELDVLPAAQYIWFLKKFPQTAFVDVSPAIRSQRMIKSAYEIEQIRRATTVVDGDYREIRGRIREGMPEIEVDGLLAGLARRGGHMGVMRIRGWNQEMPTAHVLVGETGAGLSCCETPVNGIGITPAMPQGASFGRVVRNQPIYIDHGVAINGYHSDQTRTLVIGKLDATLARAHACSVEILKQLEAEIRPGIACSEIYTMAKTIADAHGLAAHFMGHGEGQVNFLGHGIGLEIDELPVMAPRFNLPVQEGMVFALEPKFIFPALGTVGIEDDYRVTADGLERLTLTEQDLLYIQQE
ncbi:peptidase M24 [Desulfosarcina ovata subsp. sediminis]|uniref:Peptidase M24 n=1 Tax=Desulfosarcina ovata subsp. sediminis TaxID=885957 RepID=A0A5K7ZQJ2_9BACT|nr:Xaa-Pro peptidase family protein [Desulfosarcina ovata]BBO82639.1 peptidase M24 [Desulfosarcina ovata subsp. sediminis]